MPHDPYPHDAHAKDRAGMNNESEEPVENGTAFEAVRRAATNATRAGLEHELGLLSPEEVAALGEARVEAPDPNPIPAAGWVALVGLVVAVASAGKRGRD